MKDELAHISEDFREIADDCLKKWGFTAQMLKLVEECGELIQAYCKKANNQGSYRDLVEEAVDVELMISQFKHYQVSPIWFDIREEKLQRLRERLKEVNLID